MPWRPRRFCLFSPQQKLESKPTHIPIRVFLLSDYRLLRDALARALRSQGDISLVGAQESSLNIAAEILNSTCDVLLVDPVNSSALDSQILARLQGAISHLKIVTLDVEAKIADVVSAILSGSPPCQDLGYGEDPRRAADDGES